MKNLFFACLIASSGSLFSDDGSWEKDMEKIAKGLCKDYPTTEEHVGQVNPSLLILICKIATSYGKELAIHSGKRISKHHYGNAVDFRLVGNNYKDRCIVYSEFLAVYEHIVNFLRRESLYDYVGLGIYPDQNTPFFHLDLRGNKARWSRIGEDYLGIPAGLRFVSDQLKDCEGVWPSVDFFTFL